MRRRSENKQIPNSEYPKARVNPLDRPEYNERQLQAVRALTRGTATADQQKTAVDYLLNVVCQINDACWRDDSRMTDFALGQRIAGQHFMWVAMSAPSKTDPDKIAVRESMEPKK